MSEPRIGATGDYPLGKLNADDEGGLQMGIAADRRNQRVIIEFGKPIAWLGLGPTDARGLAAMLIAKAKELES